MKLTKNFRAIKYIATFIFGLVALWWIYGSYIVPTIPNRGDTLTDFAVGMGYVAIPLLWAWFIDDTYTRGL